MKKPRFALLLDLAKATEDRVRRSVGELVRQVAEVLSGIAALEENRRQAGDGGIAWRENWSAWWLRVDQEIVAQRQRLARIEADLDTARSKLAEAHRQVRTWERLRERDAATIAQATERSLARELDDLGLRGRRAGI